MTPPHTPDAASLQLLRAGILQHVGAFLAGNETAQALDAWLLDNTWNVRMKSDPTTRSLAGRVGLYLTEYAKGHRTDEQLWHLLLGLLAEIPRPDLVATPMKASLRQDARDGIPIEARATVVVAPAPAAVCKPLLAVRA